MYTKFEELPELSRVWIYQSDRQFSEDEISKIAGVATEFCNQWAAHGTPLLSSFKILHNKFLVLAVDEGANTASGCSIDSSVRFIKQLEQQLRVNFFDRTQVAFLIDNHIYTTDLNEIKTAIRNGKIDQETLTFNLQAQNLGEFNENWLVPAKDSWMKRYF